MSVRQSLLNYHITQKHVNPLCSPVTVELVHVVYQLGLLLLLLLAVDRLFAIRPHFHHSPLVRWYQTSHQSAADN